jgi:hypothetical protein
LVHIPHLEYLAIILTLARNQLIQDL